MEKTKGKPERILSMRVRAKTLNLWRGFLYALSEGGVSLGNDNLKEGKVLHLRGGRTPLNTKAKSQGIRHILACCLSPKNLK